MARCAFISNAGITWLDPGSKVSPGPIKVCRHDSDNVTPVLSAVGLAQLNGSDLGKGVPLVGRLQRPSQQAILGDRLWSRARIDAGRAEKHHLLNADTPYRFHDVGADHQVVIEEWPRLGVVGKDTANFGGGPGTPPEAGSPPSKPPPRPDVSSQPRRAARSVHGNFPAPTGAPEPPPPCPGARPPRHACRKGRRNSPSVLTSVATTSGLEATGFTIPRSWISSGPRPGVELPLATVGTKHKALQHPVHWSEPPPSWRIRVSRPAPKAR